MAQGKALLGHVYHVGDPDMIMSCLGDGSRESALGHLFHVGDADMIMSCLCTGQRKALLNHIVDPQHYYVLCVCWPYAGKALQVMSSILVTPT
jgi:hypothetical protein